MTTSDAFSNNETDFSWDSIITEINNTRVNYRIQHIKLPVQTCLKIKSEVTSIDVVTLQHFKAFPSFKQLEKSLGDSYDEFLNNIVDMSINGDQLHLFLYSEKEVGFELVKKYTYKDLSSFINTDSKAGDMDLFVLVDSTSMEIVTATFPDLAKLITKLKKVQ